MVLMASSRILRVLLLKEGSDNGWVAQGLEIDIAAQGASIKEALNNFTEVFAGQVASDLANQREPLVSKKQAPPWYWQALKHAEPLKNSIPLNLPKNARPKLGFRLTSAEAWVQ
jgi:predicted RNase H-like HicB family nuclease